MNIITLNFGVLLGSLGCINHAAAVLKRSTQPKMKPKEKLKKKILLALLFLCAIEIYILHIGGNGYQYRIATAGGTLAGTRSSGRARTIMAALSLQECILLS